MTPNVKLSENRALSVSAENDGYASKYKLGVLYESRKGGVFFGCAVFGFIGHIAKQRCRII